MRHKRALRLLATTMLLMLLTRNYAYSEVKHVSAGWITPETGYFFTETDGRDTLTALKTYRQERDQWKTGYDELRLDFAELAESTDARLKEIEDSFNADLKAQKQKVFWNVSIPLVIVTALVGFIK